MGSGQPAQDGRTICRVGPDRLEAAARRLTAAAGGDDASAARRFLDAAQAHGLDLSNFWGAFDESGRVAREVCLLTIGAGRTAMAFTSSPEGDEGMSVLAEVIDAACRDLDGSALVQALLNDEDEPLAAAYERVGFFRLSRLRYLRRAARADDGRLAEAVESAPIRLIPWRTAGDETLATALRRSYEDTLDCPELCDLRAIEDVIASHRDAGHWDPDLWWVVEADDRPAGAMLLNPSPELGAVELVYLGVAPELRGRGIASALLRFGCSRLVGRLERSLTCAVDERNTPARELYRRVGFEEFDQRLALIRPLGAGPSVPGG